MAELEQQADSSPAKKASATVVAVKVEWEDLLEELDTQLVKKTISSALKVPPKVSSSPKAAPPQPFKEHALLISMSLELKKQFSEGYQADPFFRAKWKQANLTISTLR